MKRAITETKGWGPTAFQVELTSTLSIGMFLGTGYFVQDDKPIWDNDSLDLFLELQREGRIPEVAQ